MTTFSRDDDAFEVRHLHEVLRVEAWGIDGVRVRAAQRQLPDHDVGALQLRPATPGDVRITFGENTATLVNGALTVHVELSDERRQRLPEPALRSLG